MQEVEAQLQVMDSSTLSIRNFPGGAKVTADLPELLQSQQLAWQLHVLPWQEPLCPFHEVLELLAVGGNTIRITEFTVVNCTIEFICNADLPLCDISVWS